ncbi:hypothetical protein M8J77_023796 [Diaphorina citri]|nr:hypothetical protein M8J77_023796 [Diaphorina citri]
MSTRDFLQWISVRCLSEYIFTPRMTIPECQAACRLPDHLQTTRPSAAYSVQALLYTALCPSPSGSPHQESRSWWQFSCEHFLEHQLCCNSGLVRKR